MWVDIKIGREGETIAGLGEESGCLLGGQDGGKAFPSQEALCRTRRAERRECDGSIACPKVAEPWWPIE